MSSTTTSHFGAIANVMFPVTDQDEALAFYTEVLGFEKRMDVPFGNGDRWVEVALPGGETAIALVIPPADHPSLPGVIGVSTPDADATHAALQEKGVEVGDVMRMGPPVPTMFSVADGFGNTLWVVEAPAQ